jgi:hypothetical protein
VHHLNVRGVYLRAPRIAAEPQTAIVIGAHAAGASRVLGAARRHHPTGARCSLVCLAFPERTAAFAPWRASFSASSLSHPHLPASMLFSLFVLDMRHVRHILDHLAQAVLLKDNLKYRFRGADCIFSMAVFTVFIRLLVFATLSSGAESIPNPDNVFFCPFRQSPN